MVHVDLNKKELEVITNRVRAMERLVLRILLVFTVVGFIGAYVPASFFSRGGRRFREGVALTLPDKVGMTTYIFIIVAIAVGLILYLMHEYRYWDLRKDKMEKKKSSFTTTVLRAIPIVDDTGEDCYRIWVPKNRYDVETMEVSIRSISGTISRGTKVVIEMTTNAYYPLRMCKE